MNGRIRKKRLKREMVSIMASLKPNQGLLLGNSKLVLIDIRNVDLPMTAESRQKIEVSGYVVGSRKWLKEKKR